MAIPVVTVASGGRPVIDVTATAPQLGVSVTEALNGKGTPVPKVSAAIGGMPVVYLVVRTDGGQHPK